MYRKRRTYYENEDYNLSLEEKDGLLFVHLIFFNVSKNIIKDISSKWNEIKEKCYWLGYEYIYTYTTDPRVPKLFDGWEPVTEVNYYGTKYEVIRWELKLS
mgnify:CR=1 FL=1